MGRAESGRVDRSVTPAGTARGTRCLDLSVWEACAGISGNTPTVGSLVYYFPQGHAEQALSPPDWLSLPSVAAFYLCKVKSVLHLVRHPTDEIYCEMELDPCVTESESFPRESSVPPADDGCAVSVAKELSASDASNGGGFSVPVECGDSVFPQLDKSRTHPSQTLMVRDLHGRAWSFKHIYRGNPLRHLLTTGWSPFVLEKKLVAGDCAVFVRDSVGHLFVGLRRLRPSSESFHVGGEVAEAVARAERGRSFTVVYYPGLCSSNFVVRKWLVDEARRAPAWTAGTKVRMPVESDKVAKDWATGTLSRVVRHSSPFADSPWNSLEVVWEGRKAENYKKYVNPWNVEVVLVPQEQGNRQGGGTRRKRSSGEAGEELRLRVMAGPKPEPASAQLIIPIPRKKRSLVCFKLLGQTVFSANTDDGGTEAGREIRSRPVP
ncbi:auxin response factor 10-like [Wolffia australiana]